MARLLRRTVTNGATREYVQRLLAAFPAPEAAASSKSKTSKVQGALVEPLSDRETGSTPAGGSRSLEPGYCRGTVPGNRDSQEAHLQHLRQAEREAAHRGRDPGQRTGPDLDWGCSGRIQCAPTGLRCHGAARMKVSSPSGDGHSLHLQPSRTCCQSRSTATPAQTRCSWLLGVPTMYPSTLVPQVLQVLLRYHPPVHTQMRPAAPYWPSIFSTMSSTVVTSVRLPANTSYPRASPLCLPPGRCTPACSQDGDPGSSRAGPGRWSHAAPRSTWRSHRTEAGRIPG